MFVTAAFVATSTVHDSKSRLYLEALDQQFQALLSMGKGEENEIIQHTSNEAKRMSQVLQQAKAAWRKGDNESRPGALDKAISRFISILVVDGVLALLKVRGYQVK